MNHQNNQYGNKNNTQYNANQNRETMFTPYGQGDQYSPPMQYGQYGQPQNQNKSQHHHQQNKQQYQQNPPQYNQYQTGQQQAGQQANMIKNPEKNIVHGPEMNDRDYLNDILATEKYLTDGFNTFVREASHTELHNDVKTILTDTHECTRDIFNLMFKDGFYSFQGASGQEIQQTQQKFSKYISQQDPYGTDPGF
ncbi:MAG: spore coat protein [Halanaerobiales bacterium]